jgi:hypothetical protein
VNVDFSNFTSDENQPSDCFFSPNPFDDVIHFHNNNISEEGNIQIYHILGAKIMDVRVEKNHQTIPTETLLPGMYIIQFQKDNIINNQKIVKTTSKP